MNGESIRMMYSIDKNGHMATIDEIGIADGVRSRFGIIKALGLSVDS